LKADKVPGSALSLAGGAHGLIIKETVYFGEKFQKKTKIQH
jgi:hypothetical protein